MDHRSAGAASSSRASGRLTVAVTSMSFVGRRMAGRAATVLGIIGAGGIGQILYDSINAFQFDQTGCIVLVIVVAVSMIDLLSQIIRTRLL